MGIVIGQVSSTPSTSLTLDLDALTSRVAKLLRRNDIDAEIQQWLNFCQRELTDQVNFPELRTTVVTTLDPNAATPWKLDLPSNFAREDRVYYKDDTVTPSWGRNLDPLPRKFFDQLGVERQLEVSSPVTGDPMGYFLDKTSLVLDKSPTKAAKLELTYYKLPTDMTQGGHTPDINNQWRHYLIMMAYYWGQIFLEKEDINKVALWDRKYNKTIAMVKSLVNRRENRVNPIAKPPTGLEQADRIY